VCILIPFLLLIIYQGLNCVKIFKMYKAEQKAELQAEKDALEAQRKQSEEMMAQLLAMQQQMAQQQMAQRQLMAQQQLAQQQMAYQQQMMQQMAWARQNQPMPQPPAEVLPQEEYDGQLEFDHQQTFYPPVMDDDEDFADELPEEDIYAAYRRPVPVPAPKPVPRHQTRYDDRYYDELLDEDMTDAALPPRSQYVGEDEAKAMKQEVWDRMLGGDGR
jgi:hypothetical protein